MLLILMNPSVGQRASSVAIPLSRTWNQAMQSQLAGTTVACLSGKIEDDDGLADSCILEAKNPQADRFPDLIGRMG